MYLRIFFVAILILSAPIFVEAQVPVLVDQTSLHDIEIITDPVHAQAFYGMLDDFPHTYEIRVKEPFILRAEVLIPDIASAKELVSGIIIRETGRQGKVTEVTRMLAKDASWESFYDFSGGDSYRRGGMYEAEVTPGVYRIEVSTPDNDAPYVLVIGTEKGWGDIGYIEMVARIADVKAFFGKSKLMVVQSPLVYVPILTILGVCIVVFLWKRRRV